MGNICSVRFRAKISTGLVQKFLDEINQQRFDNQLAIVCHQSLIDPQRIAGWEIKFLEYDQGVMIWLDVSGRKFEWKHHYDMVLWWVVSFFMSNLIRRINPNAKIRDEGIEERIAPDFDLHYPVPMVWLLALLPKDIVPEHVREASRNNYDKVYSELVPKFWKVAQTVKE